MGVITIYTSQTKNLVITNNTILQNNEINTAEFDQEGTIEDKYPTGSEIIIYRINPSSAAWDISNWDDFDWAENGDYIKVFHGRIKSCSETKLNVDLTTPLHSEYLFHYTCFDFRDDFTL